MVKNDVESGDFGHVYRIFDDLRTQKMEIAGEIGKNGKNHETFDIRGTRTPSGRKKPWP